MNGVARSYSSQPKEGSGQAQPESGNLPAPERHEKFAMLRFDRVWHEQERIVRDK